METFGIRLRKLREELGHSQKEFADILGTSNQLISRYEIEALGVNYEFLQNLHNKTQVNLNWLVVGVGEMFISEEVTIFKENFAMKNLLQQINTLSTSTTLSINARANGNIPSTT